MPQMRNTNLAVSNVDHSEFAMLLLSVAARLEILVEMADGKTKV
jgi:hypothetical protein